MKTFKDYLTELSACQEAIDFVKGKTFEQAYKDCERGDWLLWLFAKTNPDNLQELTLAKGHCANTVGHLLKDERSIKAIDAAIAYGEGRISIEELKIVAKAAYTAYVAAADVAYITHTAVVAADAAVVYAADAAYTAVAYAANATGVATAFVAGAADIAALAAVYAATAAVYATTAGAVNVAYTITAAGIAHTATAVIARENNQKLTANICRKYLPINIWNVKF